MGLTVKSSKMFLCGKLNEELNKYRSAHSASAQPASKNQAPCFEEYEFSDFSKKEFKLFSKSQKIKKNLKRSLTRYKLALGKASEHFRELVYF